VNPQIDPLILQKLQAFSRRRRQLIIRRGIYASVTTLLAAMMIVALIDKFVMLPDGVRWGLSGAAYLAVIIVEWRSCLRLLVHAPGSRKLARLVEHAEPRLREDLLSAVELGESKPEAIFDSEQFRALVQSDVASRMEKLDVEQLLPRKLLRRYAFMAAGIAVACIVAFAMTGFQFGTLMMRAFLPMANLARVSKVQVKIIEPSPAEMRVPQGDTLPLVIELTGQRANKAMLETLTPSGGREVVQMTPLGRDRFSATIQVGRENVLYRVRAGDAETRRYQLEAVARPAIVEFQKTYTYPAYSRLAPKSVTEENGDLAALEGSTVQLKLVANQKVRDAELRIEQGKKSLVVPLVTQGDNLVAEVPLTASGIYRVHLVGAESGFENKFSPEYELRAEPDLIPQVELELPKQDLILPSNEIVDVQGNASDDFALAKVSQLVKINEGGWKETPLVTDPGAKTKVERRWDLFEQGVKPGDLVTMKLVATDLKGNKAESRPLQVTITSAGFESKRLQALAGQQRLYKALVTQQQLATTLAKQMVDAKLQFERLGEGDPQRKQVLQPVIAAHEQFVQKAGETMAVLREVLGESVAGHQTRELSLLGDSLIRGQTVLAQNAQRFSEAIAANPAIPPARELLAEATDLTVRTEQKARQIADVDKVFLSAEEVDVFNENIYVVGQEHERLVSLAHRSGTDIEKWTPVANRLRVVLAELRSLEELAGNSIEHGAAGVVEPMRNLQKLLNKRRTALETALAGKPGVELLGPTLELSAAITETSRLASEIRRGFRNPPIERMRELTRDTEFVYTNFEFLRGELERISHNDRIPVEVGDQLMAARWQGRIGVFKGFGDVEEWRPDADTAFVNDLRLTTRVLEAMRDNNPGKPGKDFPKDLLAIDHNFRVLECGHDLLDLIEAYRHLGVAERWEIYNPKSRTANVRDWSWAGERLRAMPDELVHSLNFEEQRKLEQEVQRIVGQAPLQPFTQKLNREMEDRFNVARAPVTAGPEAVALADYLQKALDLLKQPMADARKELAKLTPTLADTMKQLAKKAEELKDQTSNQAQQAHEKLPDEAKADARQALAQQQQLNQRIDALKDALRADANQQNIMQADGRERARDADDALAMLKEPPVRAEEDLALAAKSDKSAMQEQALNQAAEQQEKLTKALEKMSEHYAALDQGKAEETRTAMRETEKENGVKEQLDQQFAKAEELASLAQKTPQELLAELEKALPQNPQMQQELSAISQNTLKSAAEQLKKASDQENAVAQNVQKMAADEKAQAAIKPTMPADQPNQPQQANAQQAGQQPNQPNQPQQANAQQAGQQPNQPNQPQQANAQQAGQQPNQPNQPKQANAQQAGQQPNQPNQPPQANAQQAGQQPNQPNQPQQANAQPMGQQPNQPGQPQQANAQQAGQQPSQANQPGAQPQTQQPNPALAQAAQQQKPIADNAGQAAADIARAGRHEERMQNPVAGEQLQKLGAALQQTAEQQVPNAQKALQQAQQAAQAQPAVNDADGDLKKALAKLNAVTNPGEAQAQGQPQAPAGTPPQGAQPNAAQQTPPQSGQQPAMAQANQANQQANAQAAQAAAQQAAGQQGQLAQAQQAQGQKGQQPQGQQAQAQPGQGQQGQQAQAQQGQAQAQAQASQQGQPGQSQQGQPQQAQNSAGKPQQGGQPAGQQPQAQAGPQGEMAAATAPATPQEQVWMARALDALDAALNAAANGQNQTAQQEGQAGQQQQQGGQNGQPQQGPQPSGNQSQAQQSTPGQPAGNQQAAQSNAMQQAQNALAAAAQAAAAQARADRASESGQPGQPGQPQPGSLQAMSKGGAQSQNGNTPHGALADAKNKAGDWGKLPKQMAEQLAQGQREGIAGEYRNQVETYYRAIAEKSKKQ